MEILKDHFTVLKLLLIWPRNESKMTYVILYGFFTFNFLIPTSPIFAAVLYQIYTLDNVTILVETLIGTLSIIGYDILYVTFLKKRNSVQVILQDINIFRTFCKSQIIEELDKKHLKYLMSYSCVSLAINIIWPVLERTKCTENQASDFYRRHDPCGLPTRNLYPFDSTKTATFCWELILEAYYIIHFGLSFGTISIILFAVLEHIAVQLKECALKFHNINYEQEEAAIYREFKFCVRYHQIILSYANRVFDTFSPILVAYISITSIVSAVIACQMMDPHVTILEKARYTLLLLAWVVLFFASCWFSQKIQNESVKISDAIYCSGWYKQAITADLKKSIIIALANSQKPLNFNIRFYGTVSLPKFVAAMKTGYSFFTLLLTITDD